MDINEDSAGLWLGCGKGGFCVSAGGRIRCLVRPVYAIINIFVFLCRCLLVTPCSGNNRRSELPNLVIDSALEQVDSSSDPSSEPTWRKDRRHWTPGLKTLFSTSCPLSCFTIAIKTTLVSRFVVWPNSASGPQLRRTHGPGSTSSFLPSNRAPPPFLLPPPAFRVSTYGSDCACISHGLIALVLQLLPFSSSPIHTDDHETMKPALPNWNYTRACSTVRPNSAQFCTVRRQNWSILQEKSACRPRNLLCK